MTVCHRCLKINKDSDEYCMICKRNPDKLLFPWESYTHLNRTFESTIGWGENYWKESKGYLNNKENKKYFTHSEYKDLVNLYIYRVGKLNNMLIKRGLK